MTAILYVRKQKLKDQVTGLRSQKQSVAEQNGPSVSDSKVQACSLCALEASSAQGHPCQSLALCTEIIRHAGLQTAASGANLAARVHRAIPPAEAGTRVGQHWGRCWGLK